MNNPDQYQDVIDNPKLLRAAITETLRFNSPVQLIPRQLSESFTLHNTHLKTGDTVICMIELQTETLTLSLILINLIFIEILKVASHSPLILKVYHLEQESIHALVHLSR